MEKWHFGAFVQQTSKKKKIHFSELPRELGVCCVEVPLCKVCMCSMMSYPCVLKATWAFAAETEVEKWRWLFK